MFCANHPDVQAMASCRVCGKPLCPVCVYFHDGVAYCHEHYPEVGAGTVAFEQARGGADDETKSFAEPSSSGEDDGAPEISGAATPLPVPPELPPQQPGQWNQGWTPPPTPHWSYDPRLTPLPMEQRPGWTEEPLAPVPGSADALGTAGVVIGAVALVASFCCGLGAPAGLVLGLLGGGLAIGALRGAGRARNPQHARNMGVIGIVIAVIAVLGGLCMTALLLGVGFNSLFFNN